MIVPDANENLVEVVSELGTNDSLVIDGYWINGPHAGLDIDEYTRLYIQETYGLELYRRQYEERERK